MALKRRLKFSIRSRTHYLKLLRQLLSGLDKVFPGVKIDHEKKMRLAIALVEAVDNVIFHAHKKDPDSLIDIEIIVNSDYVEVSVFDRGQGFEMPDMEDPDVQGVSGRGLFMIRSVMDRVEYVRGKVNVLKMVCHLGV